jgi:hypothetical protein
MKQVCIKEEVKNTRQTFYNFYMGGQILNIHTKIILNTKTCTICYNNNIKRKRHT